MIIGLPTLRLRGDYIAIVTLAFGEIIGRLAVNFDQVKFSSIPLLGGPLGNFFGEEQVITAGRQGITPVDKIAFPGLDPFTSLELKPWYWTALGLVAIVLFVNFRLRDSRLGRAWIALREDEVAAVSMGVPAVKTKLLAYGTGAAFGGMSGAYLGSFLNTVNADQFQFYFSILILGMVILGGLGSIWGVVLGAIVLSFINNWLIPDVLNDVPGKLEPRLRHDADHLRDLRLPARDHDDPAAAGPATGTKARAGADARRRARRRIRLRGTRMSETNGNLVLDATNVTKQFGGLTAVSDVTFHVPERSIVSIIGPNGAGKTTFFNMLTGFYKPTYGRIDFDGKNVTGGRPDVIMKLGMARTFQNIRLFATMSAVENCMVGQNSRMKAGLFGSIIRTPGVRKEEKRGRREGARGARRTSGSPSGTTTGWRSTSPTASSGGWRSPARWRPTRRCCCSTSRRRA